MIQWTHVPFHYYNILKFVLIRALTRTSIYPNMFGLLSDILYGSQKSICFISYEYLVNVKHHAYPLLADISLIAGIILRMHHFLTYSRMFHYLMTFALFGNQHFWVAISMVFLIAATTFTLLKLSGKFPKSPSNYNFQNWLPHYSWHGLFTILFMT